MRITGDRNVIKLSQGADVTESLVEKLGSFFLPSECADSCDSCFSDQIERYGNLKQKSFEKPKKMLDKRIFGTKDIIRRNYRGYFYYDF